MAGQKKRATKTSKGIHGGGGKTRLTPLERVLLGKGQYASFAALGTKENPVA